MTVYPHTKIWLDNTPPGYAVSKQDLIRWCRAVGIRVCVSHEPGVTHFATTRQWLYAPKAQLARQGGARVITFNELLAMVRERSEQPVAPPPRPALLPLPSAPTRAPRTEDSRQEAGRAETPRPVATLGKPGRRQIDI